MELKELLLPLVTECRKQFADNSLMLVIEAVKISKYHQTDQVPKSKQWSSPEAPPGFNNLKLLEISTGTDKIQGYSGEIRYWQSKPCKNLHEMTVGMVETDNLDILSSKILQTVVAWRRENVEEVDNGEFTTLLRFDIINNEEYIVCDDEILNFLQYSLQVHFGTELQISVETVERVALPIAIFRQLWITVEVTDYDKIDMNLYDFEGCDCGYIYGINFSNKFSTRFGKFQAKLDESHKSRVSPKSTANPESHSCEMNEPKPFVGPGINYEIQDSTETDIRYHSDFHTEISKPMTGAEIKAVIKEEVRKLAKVMAKTSYDDDRASFASLGFDSLKLARLEFALQDRFSGMFSIPYGTVHQHPSVDILSKFILGSSTQENRISEFNKEIINLRILNTKLKTIVKSGSAIPLSSAQKRLIFLHQLNSEEKLTFVENVSFKMRNLKTNQFRRAFNRLVARHTALRTVYTTTGQIVSSLTEAHFRICPVSRSTSALFMPISELDSGIPMRIFVIPQKCSSENQSSNNEIFSDRSSQEQVEKIQENNEIRNCRKTEITNTKSLDSTRHRITIQLHHIMVDGFSIKLLTKELRELYYAEKSLQPTEYQYAHYVLLEEEQRKDSENQKLREVFWKHLLSKVELQQLPLNKTLKQAKQYSGQSLQVELNSKAQECLQSIAICCNVTQFAVLLASFQLLQYKRYGFKDSCTGITAAQRETPELCTIVGCMLNVVPVINTVDSKDTIRGFVMKSYNRLNESVQKQIPFDDLMRALHLKRDLPNSPLFQVLLILDDNTYGADSTENDDKEEYEVNNQNLEDFQNGDSNFARYDQVWYFKYHSKGITIKIEYNAQHFYKDAMETTLQQYLRLLQKMSQNLRSSVKSLKMTNRQEEFDNYQQRIANRSDFIQKCTILELIDKQNRIGGCCNTVIQEAVPFSSLFLQRISNQLARYLTQRCLQFTGENSNIDNFVLVIFDRSISLLIMIFALWKCGIAAVPINPATPSDQVNKITEDLSCLAVIYGHSEKQRESRNRSYGENPEADPKGNSRILSQKLNFQNTTRQDYGDKIFNMDEMINSISDYADRRPRKKANQYDLAYMTFTSGSTGLPKGICTEFYGLNNLALNYAEILSIKPSSIIYQVVNPSFDIFFADILEAQTNGASLQLASQRIPDLEEMSKVTHAYIMPAYLSAIQAEELKKLTNLEKINFGGDYIQRKTLQDCIQDGLHLYHQYGMTEHSIYSTCKLMKIGEKPSLVGKPLKNIHFFICDSDKNMCAQRTTGICCTSGPGISRGYHNNPDLNQKSFFKNHDLTKHESLLCYDSRNFWTGDLAEIRNSVGELFFHGRNDLQVKIRGMRIEIPAIEAILEEHESVKRCIVCLQNIRTEQLLVAYISPHKGINLEGKGSRIQDSLNKYLSTKLPSYMIPKQYVLIKEFPLNINGKIDRKQLPMPQKATDVEAHPEKDQFLELWEKQIMEIFAASLPGKAVRLEDSFFDVGGDSLKALLVTQTIKHELGVDLQLRHIFQLPSFKAILEHLKRSDITIASGKSVNTVKPDAEKPDPVALHESKTSTADSTAEGAIIGVKDSEELEKGIVRKWSITRRDTIGTETTNVYKKSGEIQKYLKPKNRFWFDRNVPVSLPQERIMFLYSFGNEIRDSYKLQFLIKFLGFMSIGILNTALNYVVRKHRLLRTIFLHKADKTIQEVISLSECYIETNKKKFHHSQNIAATRAIADVLDLYNNPLLAVTVSGTESENLEVLLLFDHLIVDGRSIAILANDLVDFYNRLASGGTVPADISDEEGSYAEFCIKQRSQLEKLRAASENTIFSSANETMGQDKLQASGECKRLQEMVLKLRDFPSFCLQGDIDGDEMDIRGESIRLKMPINLSKIKQFCAEQRCTLFVYLLCTFSLTMRFLLAEQQQQQQQRFAVLTSALNRTPRTMNCVGLFVNAVIIPIDINFLKISDLIQNLQQNNAEALQFQHVPYEYIIQKLNPKRSSTGSGAYQTLFAVHSASAVELPEIAGVKTVVEEIPNKYAKFEQSWSFIEFQDHIEMMMEYRRTKYSNSLIRRVMDLFAQVALELLSNRSTETNNILQCVRLNYTEKIMTGKDDPEDVVRIQETSKTHRMTALALEEMLLEIWKEVLADPEISISDNFFAKGGHSLLLSSIYYRIKERTGYKCSPHAIFKYQTVRELSGHISSKLNLKPTKISKQEVKVPVCPLQEQLARLYFNAATTTIPETGAVATATTVATSMNSTDLIKAYQTGFSISLNMVNSSKLKQALNSLVLRHSALRSTFYRQDNEFLQEIHSGTEIYIALRKTTSNPPTMTLPNPFHTAPILCWLICSAKQGKPDDTVYELHFQISHAVCDGKSLSIVARELQCHFFENKRIPLKNQDYTSFSKQIEQRFTKRRAEMKTFWFEALEGVEGMKLHCDKVINISSSNKCKFFRKKFKNLHNLIKNVAKNCCCSPFAVQLAAFGKALSGRVPQASNVLIACPVDMRDSDTEFCVGMCVNILPIVINLEHRNLRNLILDTAKNLANVYANADISSSEIEKLCEKRGISNFTDIMIVNNYEEETSSEHYRLLSSDSEFTKCSLTLFVMQQREDVIAKIEFKQDFFYNETVAMILEHWAKIIHRMEKAIASEDKKVAVADKRKSVFGEHFVGEYRSETILLERNITSGDRYENRMEKDECERKYECREFFTDKKDDKKNFRKCDFPVSSFQNLLWKAVTNTDLSGIKTSLIGNNQSINYHNLTGRIYQTSEILQQKTLQTTGEPLRSDTVVPIVAHKGVEALITCLAVIISGAAYLPLDFSTPVKRILDILDQIRATTYVTVDKSTYDDEEVYDNVNASIQGVTEINLNEGKTTNDEYWYKSTMRLKSTSADLAYVIFTSGTTGKPKGVAIGQRGLINMAVSSTRDFWMKPTDCVYQFTNFTFDNSVLEVTVALVNGCVLLVRENFFLLDEFLTELKHARMTHALLFPGLVSTFTDKEIRELQHLRYWVVGAESANAKILECALKAGVNVIQNYGPTETTAYALTRRMKMLDKPNNIGRGITNVNTAVRNFAGEMVPRMCIGELHISGAGIMRGYVISHSATEKSQENERKKKGKENFGIGANGTFASKARSVVKCRSSFVTKDMVLLQPNNSLLFLGRCDQQVKIHGYRIELGEIEAILCQYPQIKSAKVILKFKEQQQRQQHQLAAYVILSKSKEVFDPDAVRRFLLQHLPYYMVPTQYYCLQQYPLTKNSKIDVAGLKALENPAHSRSRKHLEPENSTERMLLGFFQKILENDMISVSDNFFAVGGNSFSAAQLIQLINVNTASHLDVRDVFQYSTARKLAKRVLETRDRLDENNVIHDSREIRRKGIEISDIPLSFQQQQFRFLNETKQHRYYELIFIQKFDSSVNLRHLGVAFLRLILQQPSLRTIFPERNYETYQEILSGTEAYFHSYIQNNIFQMNSTSCNENLIAEKIKMLQSEKVDLQHEPPISSELQATSNESYAVILRINHIISDAWSTNILETHLSHLYQQILENKSFSGNTKLQFTYADYSIEQFQEKPFLEKLGSEYADKIVKWIASYPDYNKFLDNWKKSESQEYRINPDNLNSNSENSKIVQESNPATSKNYLETGFTIKLEEIEDICGYFEVTPFVVFLGAFTLSLHKVSATKQLIINVPAANRISKTSDIIGNFLNYLLISSTYAAPEVSYTTSGTTNDGVRLGISEVTAASATASSTSSSLLKYIRNLATEVNALRQFEQVPFIVLMEMIRKKLKEMKLSTTEILDRLHKSIFFNFRYGLEGERETVLGKGETQAPTNCIHEIEVDVDCHENSYCCRIRMNNNEMNAKRLKVLCQQMITCLQQMSIDPEAQGTVRDETGLGRTVSKTSMKQSFRSPNSHKSANVDSQLRRIWSKCLGKEWIRDEDDFFLEGGNSLLTLKLRRLIELEMQVDVEIDEIFQYSTFAQMRDLIQMRLIEKKDLSLNSGMPESRTSEGGVIHDSEIQETMEDGSVSRKKEHPLLQSDPDGDSKSQNAQKTSQKNEFSGKTENVRLFEKQTTIRLLYQNDRGVDNSGNSVIVFFHALVGGVRWTYAPLVQQLVTKLPDSFRIIGVEHPDSFQKRSSGNYAFYRSIEILCSEYVRDLYDHLCNAKSLIFIGASFGAILAYQCAVQLQQKGIHVDEMISIDGTSRWSGNASSIELSFEEHRQQITEIVMRRAGNIEVDSTLLEAMIDNAWELLKMMRMYVPSRSLSRLHVTLMKSKSISGKISDDDDEDDYGWKELCERTVVSIPFSHDTMLDNSNAGSIAAIIIEAISHAKHKMISS